ncbi:MAG: aminomethyl-transferring glycine dehydrogenase subunit GcvPA [Bdellovibrionota bacterium]
MRYLPLTTEEEKRILQSCEEASFETLTRDIPENLRIKKLLNLPEPLHEAEMLEHIQELGEKNTAPKMCSLLGQGAYDHTWPAVIDYLVTRGEFLTAYTPYQPEVSQGTLQAIFEFQSMVSELFGMEVSNASLYDGSTALVEAILMSARLQGKSSGQVLVSEGVYDRTQEILKTYLTSLGFELVTWQASHEGLAEEKTPLITNPVAVVMQSPNKWGLVEDWKLLKKTADTLNTKSIAHVSHTHSLALFESPGTAGIDIASGEGQSLGIPIGFGGPYLGLFTCLKKDIRQMPGRLVGKTVDARNREAYCVTLSTREQHIRREKATSNICSNQSLMALRACIYMALYGPVGIKKVADSSRRAATAAREIITKQLKNAKGLKVLNGTLLNEFSILYSAENERKVEKLQAAALSQNVILGLKNTAPVNSGFKGALSLAFTERFKKKNAESLEKIFGELIV